MPKNSREVLETVAGGAAIRPVTNGWADAVQQTLTAALILCSVTLIAVLIPTVDRTAGPVATAEADVVADADDRSPRRERGLKFRVRAGRGQSGAFGW